MLAAVSARCPALLELKLHSYDLDQPAAPLAHLTHLELEGCFVHQGTEAALASLAAAASRLEALTWSGHCDDGVAEATAGHPGLERLRVRLHNMEPDAWAEESWLSAAPRLPALAFLEFGLRQDSFAGEELDGRADPTAQLLRLCGWLRRCEQLPELHLAVLERTPVADAPAAVGAALGNQLDALTLSRVALPETRADAARALHVLATSFQNLEALSLLFDVPDDADAATTDELARGVLQAAPAVARLCPALTEVQVAWDSGTAPDGRHTEIWRRPRRRVSFCESSSSSG